MRGYAGARPPAWLTTLILAKEWGCPPWEVAAMRGGLKWAARWQAWQAQIDKAREMDRKQGERRAKMKQVR